MTANVTTCAELERAAIDRLIRRFGLQHSRVVGSEPIPASFWGEPEAGIRGSMVFTRGDTPVHSLLHELSHLICMPTMRRADLDRDAGSDDDEENAVCYLQVLLADYLPRFGRLRCFADMDAWGYSFRQGSARRWFGGDGRDARRWLLGYGLIDAASKPTWQLRP